jgi:hypothetical protein
LSKTFLACQNDDADEYRPANSTSSAAISQVLQILSWDMNLRERYQRLALTSNLSN